MKTLYILTALGVIAMLAELFKFKKLLLPVMLLGLLGAVAAAVKDWNTDIHYYSNMLNFNNYALVFSIALCVIAFLWILSNQDLLGEGPHQTDFYALSLFSLCGAVIMVSYSNMVMLFLGIEILSIPIYVLAGSKKNDLASNESALKYFLMGAFATCFLLFGIALIYGATGTFDLSTLTTYLTSPESISSWRPGADVLLNAGILMMLIGLCFKVAAVPFHFWTPDVYEGAPSPVTAFMSTIVKTAAFAAFLRLFMTCFIGYSALWTNVIWILAALSILLGNVTAVYQSNVKRMLAYSSISHAGYMLLAVLTSGSMSAGAVLYYSAAYSVATIAAFTVLSIIEKNGGQIIFDSFNGLAKKNKLLAFSMTIAMLSLAGIPPLAGFFGKYYLFASALKGGYVWLVLIAALGSLIGVYYYLKVVIVMYTSSPNPSPVGEGGIEISLLQKIALILCFLLSLAMGFFPELIIRLI